MTTERNVELDRLRELAEACRAEWVDGTGWVLPIFTFQNGSDESLPHPTFPLKKWIETRRGSTAKLGYLKREAGRLVDVMKYEGYSEWWPVVQCLKDVEFLLKLIVTPVKEEK